MTDKYSIVFQPDDKLIESVRTLKLQLAEEIGWYNSKNALAHITIVKFDASTEEITRIHHQITRCSERFKPVIIQFNSFGSYPNGAVYLEVDIEAKEVLKEYNRQLIDELRIKFTGRSNDPHLSIARKLNPEKTQKALELLDTPQLITTIGNLALRKLNPIRKQYDIVQLYPLLDLGDTRDKQLSLF